MKNKKILQIVLALLGLIIVSFLLYYSIEQQKKNVLTKAVENRNCIVQSKLCAYTKHKYFDGKLQIQIQIFPGKFYFSEDFKLPEEYNVASLTYAFGDYTVDNWVDNINGKNTFLKFEFEDKDGFLIDTLLLNLDGNVRRTRLVNSDGNPYGLEFSTNFLMSEKSYRRISFVDMTWNNNLSTLLPSSK